MQNMTSAIAVIGGGFSGSLLAVHLLHSTHPSTRIYLIERNERFGRGLAYSTGNPAHLLNVPAGKMSAFQDQPDHFLDWLASHGDAQGPSRRPAGASDFVPRGTFGSYIQDLLGQHMWQHEGPQRLYLVPDEAADIRSEDNGLTITLACGRPIRTDIAVLAIGNFPPEAPPLADRTFIETSPRYHGDPWRLGTLDTIDPLDPVLLIGTGLTMVDTAISLWDRGHAGRIHAISRRGLRPHRHVLPLPAITPFKAEDFPPSALGLLRLIRQTVERTDQDWRAVIDALRPFTQQIWQSLDTRERRKFLRHLRPWWDIHRHRLAPRVADRIENALREEKLCLHAGRLRTMTETETAVQIEFTPRGGQGLRRLEVGHVVNCSGPACDFNRIRQPLIRGLLEQGVARADTARLGLEVTADLRLIGRDGLAAERLYAVGPVTKGRFWEITAVPDIRRQCEFLASRLAALTPA
ncbi:FAD/NAD(P)-binding protein [Telmatospirillum sp. J64-1]|uniref:FAD/NAD(P)-binding protein n=1 Tax=Telmatospirillum sp. J64-1 TaxID=2502183 RepID=UPI00163D41F8|nr:FAD/NAD(P)-binding protein [Telmatospirillum sp. J64-1]